MLYIIRKGLNLLCKKVCLTSSED